MTGQTKEEKTMTTEEKQLLLKDLRARLSCGVVVRRTYYTLDIILDDNWAVKPYLRPMSSMTEEEEDEYQECGNKDIAEAYIHLVPNNRIDWLNAHHFDYRRLIEKGLAIKAPEGMYKTE